HVEEEGAQVEDGVAPSDHEVVERRGAVEGDPVASLEGARGIEAVQLEGGPLGRERDAEVDQLARLRVDLRVRRKRGDFVDAAAESVEAAGLQGLPVEVPGEPLLAEGEVASGERIDADVDRRGERDAAQQAVARERGAEGAVERAAGRLLLDPL